MHRLHCALAACSSPTGTRRIHGWLTVGWLMAGVPIMIWFREAVPIVVFMSLWANVAAHWGGWQSARTEVRQEASES